MKRSELLKELIDITNEVLQGALNLKNQPNELLNAKPSESAWSALECLEHLNRYGDFYHPEIKRRLQKATPSTIEKCSSSWLGNYFAQSMKPGAKPMSTFKNMNPTGSSLSTKVLDTFIQQQKELLEILESCKKYNLIKVKTAISISKLIKLRLGDTLRVVIYHNQRHMAQANRALKSSLAA